MKKKESDVFLSLIGGMALAIAFLSMICLGFADDGESINYNMVVICLTIMVISSIIAFRAMAIIEKREKK